MTDMTRPTPYEKYKVECDPGWKGLYEPLIALCNLWNIEVAQVKEKFGGLRFYIGSVDSRLNDLIRAAEAASYKVCEMCGFSGGEWKDGIYKPLVTTEGKWRKTLCKDCRIKRDASLQV